MPIKLHDGSKIVFRKVNRDYDPTSRAAAFSFLRDSVNAGEIMTGLLYIDEETGDMHDLSGSVEQPLSQIPYQDLNPGKDKLAKLMDRYR
jgi:2-oxoglutarate ferredoxin oxidoreductase subunit beta